MSLPSKSWLLAIDDVRAAATSFTITADDLSLYNSVAFDGGVLVSFNLGAQAFPLAAGVPIALPGGVTTIELDVAAKLYFGK